MLTITNKTSGFTLIELLISLLILATLITIAAPVSHDFLASHRSKSHINTLARALYFARSEAIQRGEKVIFCGSKDAKTCGGDWRNGQITQSASNELLRIFPALPKSDRLVWNSSGGKDAAIEWLPTGYTNGQRGSFYYCTPTFSGSRTLVLLDTGRWYIETMNQADFDRFCLRQLIL